MAVGFQYANLVALPASHAGGIADLCRSNSPVCPVLDVLPAGPTEPPPLHWGNPAELGISDLSQPDFREPSRCGR